MRKAGSVILIITGTLVLILGLAFAGMYIHSIWSVLDQPDKSAIFWHIPLLFVGIIGTGAGIGLIIGGKSRLHNK